MKVIANKVYYVEVIEGGTIFTEGDKSETFYILEKGLVEVHFNDKQRTEIKPGEGFGDLALQYAVPRTSVAKAAKMCHLWVLEKNNFRVAIEEATIIEFERNIRYLERMFFWENLQTHNQIDSLASLVTVLTYREQEIIFEEGEPGSSAYIIMSGSIECESKSRGRIKLSKGEVVGELSLQYNTIRTHTAKALEKTSCIVIGRELLTRIVGPGAQHLVLKNYIKTQLQADFRLLSLNSGDMETLLDIVRVIHFSGGTTQLKKDESIDNVYLMIEGILMEMGTNKIACDEGKLWGYDFINLSEDKRIIEDEIYLDRDSVIAQIPIDWLSKHLHKYKDEGDADKKQGVIDQSKQLGQSDIYKIGDVNEIMALDSNPVATYMLVRAKASDTIYAMKKISIQEAKGFETDKYIYNELEALERLTHPFILPYIKHIQTDQHVYFFYKYIPSMTLYEVIRKIGLQSSLDCQFYLGTIISILEHLRDIKVIHRDIKPENFIVDGQGYLMQSDFSVCHPLKKASDKTMTNIGTPHYMAPEVILGKNYDYNVDLWSTGVLLYEFMCGHVPFGEESEDPYDIFEDIIKGKFTFPPTQRDQKLITLNKSLQNENSELRLMGGEDFGVIKSCPFFYKFQWDLLHERQIITTPYIPPEDLLNWEKKNFIVKGHFKNPHGDFNLADLNGGQKNTGKTNFF